MEQQYVVFPFKGFSTQNRELHEFLDNEADFSTEDENGRMPLHYIMIHYPLALLRNENLLLNILSKTTDINAQDKWGRTPLHYLLRYKGILDSTLLSRTLYIFLDSGANFDDADKDKRTQFHYIMMNREQVVLQDPNLLIKLISKANVINAQDKRSRTPLHCLLYNYNLNPTLLSRSLRIFLDNGADFNAENEDRRNPLHYLMMYHVQVVLQNSDLFEDVISKTKVINAQDDLGRTPLYCLLGWSKHLDSTLLSRILCILLDNRADFDIADYDKMTPINYLMKNNPLVVLQNLDLTINIISKTKDINAQDQWGRTPLYCLLAYNKDLDSTLLSKTLRIFFENGADFDTADKNKETILHYIMLNNVLVVLQDSDLFENLISKMKNINAKDKFGNTPLSLLMKNKLPNSSQLLKILSLFLCSKAGAEVIDLLFDKGYNYNEVYRTINPFSENNICSPCCSSAGMICSCNKHKVDGLQLLLQFELLKAGDKIFCTEQTFWFSKLFPSNCKGQELIFWREKFDACVSELLQMKQNVLVPSCNYTLYNHVSQSREQQCLNFDYSLLLARLADYPHYRDIITSAIDRQDLLEQNVKFSLHADKQSVLNTDCCALLTNYLTTQDLKKILIPPVKMTIFSSSSSCRNKKRKLSE